MQRFRFMYDDDGHDYIVPANETSQFRKWLDAGPYWEGYKGKDYSDYAIGRSPNCYTFTDPQEEEDMGVDEDGRIATNEMLHPKEDHGILG